MLTLRTPLQLDSRRRVAVATTPADVVRAQIIDVLVTARGERPFRPNYGAGVPEMLFSNIDPAIFEAKANEIKNVLSAYVRGGTVAAVRISETGEIGRVRVTVLFTLIPGGEVFEAAQTFDGIVTEESFFNGQ